MKTIKLSVLAVFAALCLGAFWTRPSSVAGQASAVPDAPTGVIASDSKYNNKVMVYWDAIKGATAYRIFRNSINDPSSATDLGTSATISFADTGVVANQTFYYWVRAENGSNLSLMSASDTGSRTATANQGNIAPLAPPPAAPTANPTTAAKIYLGKTLFWDEQLSSTRTVACGTCHHSSSGGVDPRGAALSTFNPGPDGVFGNADDVLGSAGVPFNNAAGSYVSTTPYGLSDQVTNRRSMPYINAAYPATLFWDGRATGVFRDPITNNILINGGAALESQAAGPPVNSGEMAHTGRDWNDVALRVAGSKPLALSPTVPAGMSKWLEGRTYPDLFTEAFGSSDVTPAKIIMAIAAFERTLYSDQAPIDLAAMGITQLDASAQRGRNIFGPLGCGVCHGGNLFTDNAFHNIGVRPQAEDSGRFAITGSEQNRSEFRTPNLRNVELRGSYFHNGRFTTLQQVIDFYDRGGDFDAPNLATQVNPLGLNQGQKNDLIAFLRSFTDPRVAAETAPFDRPRLFSESDRVPAITGSGRAGTGSAIPAIKSVSPPIAGNTAFTVSVSNALGNADAVLVVNSTDTGVASTIPAAGDLALVSSHTQNTGSTNGWASVTVSIPQSAVGNTYYARWYITDPAAANGFSVSPAARFTVFGDAVTVSRAAFDDFDGDRKTDISVFRPASNTWFILNSNDSTLRTIALGTSNATLTPADYDGDGKTDAAVFNGGSWTIALSGGGTRNANFGSSGDIAQPGDYDGDGKADLAVFRPSQGIWYILASRDGFSAAGFGQAGDRPVAADYDGDGRTDVAVYRGGFWFVMQSTAGFYAAQFGLSDDKPVIGDYDGDGHSDLAVWRPSNGAWYVWRSSNSQLMAGAFGISTDTPVPGDYDGDGKNEFAVFRPGEGNWYFFSPANSSFRAANFGVSTDLPVPNSVVP